MSRATPHPLARPVEDVGRKLRELRKARQYTQADLAARIGIQQSDLCRMENGQYRVSLDTLVKILAELKVSMSEFFQENQRTALSSDEATLLQIYRHLSHEHRVDLMRFARFIGEETDLLAATLMTRRDRAAATELSSPRKSAPQRKD